MKRYSAKSLELIAVLGLSLLAGGLTGCFESNSEKKAPALISDDGGGDGGGGGGRTTLSVGSDTLDIAPDTSGTVVVLKNDTPANAGDTLTIESYDVTSKEGGTVTLNSDGSFTYTPKPGFEGTDSFGYVVKDGHGNTDSTTVMVTVSGDVIINGNQLYADNCAICHKAGADDQTSAFASSDLAGKSAMMDNDMSVYGGEYRLMGAFYNMPQKNVDQLKAYLAALTP